MQKLDLLLLVTSLTLTASFPTVVEAKATERPWLGVVLVRDDADRLLVESVETDSPAEEAGLLTNDRLLAIGGERVGFVPGMLLDFAPGDRVSIAVERDGTPEDLEVTLREWPEWRSPPPLPVYRRVPSTPGKPSHLDRQQA